MNGKLLSSCSCRKSMATAAMNSKEPDLMKIIATTLKHMDLQTTLNHYVDFTYPKDSSAWCTGRRCARICLGLPAGCSVASRMGLVG
jgi:hypothetical protein